METTSDKYLMISNLSLSKRSQTLRNMFITCFWMVWLKSVYTFFLICSASNFHWTEMIGIIAQQYGETLIDKEVNNMDWSVKV